MVEWKKIVTEPEDGTKYYINLIPLGLSLVAVWLALYVMVTLVGKIR